MTGDRPSQTSTDELLAELNRLQHRDKLLDVAEQLASIGHCEWDYDNNRILACSEGYARIYGMSVADVLSFHANWDNVIQQIHPEDPFQSHEACDCKLKKKKKKRGRHS